VPLGAKTSVSPAQGQSKWLLSKGSTPTFLFSLRLPFVAVSNWRHLRQRGLGSTARGRTPLNEYKRLAWQAFRQLERREEEVGTGCAKEQTRQVKEK